MIKLSVNFNDAEGHEYPTELCFNLTRTDLIKLYTASDMDALSNVSDYITKDGTRENLERILRATDDLLRLSYGRIVTNPETRVRTFQKKDEWTEEFMGGPLADAVFEKFFWSGDAGLESFIKFIQKLIPDNLTNDFLASDEEIQQNHANDPTVSAMVPNPNIAPAQEEYVAAPSTNVPDMPVAKAPAERKEQQVWEM